METERVALVAPAGPFRYEAQTILRGTAQDTPRIVQRFNRPVHILGIYPSLAVASRDALVMPTLDDVMVSLEIENDRRLTSRVDTVASGESELYATLGSYRDALTGTASVVDLPIQSPNPVVSASFRWKLPVAGQAYFKDVFVGVTYVVRWL